MIYLVDEKIYPTKEFCSEEIEYRDQNDFLWKIARVENGFFIRYFGDKYFSDQIFCVQPKGKNLFMIFNTCTIFYQDADFEAFCSFRDILKEGYTDDIWEAVKFLLEERFLHDEGMLESEKCEGKI